MSREAGRSDAHLSSSAWRRSTSCFEEVSLAASLSSADAILQSHAPF